MIIYNPRRDNLSTITLAELEKLGYVTFPLANCDHKGFRVCTEKYPKTAFEVYADVRNALDRDNIIVQDFTLRQVEGSTWMSVHSMEVGETSQYRK